MSSNEDADEKDGNVTSFEAQSEIYSLSSVDVATQKRGQTVDTTGEKCLICVD